VLAARGASLDSRAKTFKEYTGFVRRIGAWRWARARQREKQEGLWIAHTELASAPGHPFYQRLNELLEAEASTSCREAVREVLCGQVRASVAVAGIYFRSLLIGYFEASGGARDCWRLATRWRCGALWAFRWTSTRRITRRSRARDG